MRRLLQTKDVLTRAALIGAVLLQACASAPVDRQPGGAITPALLLAKLEERNQTYSSMRVRARVVVRQPGGGGVFDQEIVVRKPDRLRFETLHFFGSPVAALMSNGKEFAMLDFQFAQFVRGPATPENVSRHFPMVVEGREIAALMTGTPLPVAHSRARIAPARRGNRVILVLESPGDANAIEQAIEMDTGSWVPRRVAYKSGGQDVRSITYDEYDLTRTPPAPSRFTYQDPKGGIRIEAALSSIRVNVPTEDAEFEPRMPGGFTDISEAFFRGATPAPSAVPATAVPAVEPADVEDLLRE
ncbi:MAG: hypothetical protein GMKNLPBB_02274 [Myxococcota bacterium]|nr:hypothetical protein [Myxococcota bacterium]